MGAADIVPGVSGGTMALIVGIYERLIDAIRDAVHGTVDLVRGHGTAGLRAVPWSLVLPLGLGILTALGIGVVVIEPLLEAYPVGTSALFAGLILGALPIPWRRVHRRSWGVYATALAAGGIAFALAGLTAGGPGEPGPGLVFVAAAVAICAMILPGVSGAYLLLIFGMYEPTLRAARELDIAYVATFAAGAVTGLAAFSKLLSWLLDHRHDLTMAALVGLMAGSLRRLWPWQTEAGALIAPDSGGGIVLALALALGGLVFVLVLERFGSKAAQPPPVDATGDRRRLG